MKDKTKGTRTRELELVKFENKKIKTHLDRKFVFNKIFGYKKTFFLRTRNILF